MDDAVNGGAAAGEEAEPSSQVGEIESGEVTDSVVVAKAQKLIDRITSAPDRPNAKILHALASILEIEEAKYTEEYGQSNIANAPPSHNISRLGALLRDNDEFFELISSKFLSERQYQTSVKGACARLLISCSQTWMFPHVFEESVVENLEAWVMDDSDRACTDESNWTEFFGQKMPTDAEILRTYSTGLLAVCLAGDVGQGIEDVLRSGLPAKLMHYLRTRLLRDSSSNPRVVRGDELSGGDNRRIAGHTVDERQARRACGGSFDSYSSSSHDTCSILADTSPINMNVDNQQSGQEFHKSRSGDTTFFDRGKDQYSRHKANRVPGESTGKGRALQASKETEQAFISAVPTLKAGPGRNLKEKKLSQDLDLAKRGKIDMTSDGAVNDNFECFRDCKIGSRDISDLVIKAVRSAAAEARAANAPEEAVKAAIDSAAEVVKSAALEEFEKSNDEEAAATAASEAALTVIDAANIVEVSRQSNSSKAPVIEVTEPEIKEDIEDLFIRNHDDLAKLREKFCIQCLEVLGEYVEVLGPVVHEKGVDVCIELLLRCSEPIQAVTNSGLLSDVLKLICALCAHRKFAAMFVDRGGMQKLLAVSRVDQTLVDISSCLFTIGSLQGIMERVCALPSVVVHQMVKLALQLLECPQDQARKNAALFFNAAFVFHSVLDSFDSQDGLHKLLSVSHDAASVRSGTNSGALGLSTSRPFRNDRSPSEVLTSSEKQIAFHTCAALRQYFRAHLLLLVESIRPSKINRATARNSLNIRAPNKPLDISNEAMDAIFIQLQKDKKLVNAFAKAKWPAVDKFIILDGPNIMLELCQAPPDERYLHDLVQYALGVLHVVTFVPYSRRHILNATLSNNRVGVAVLLDAANYVNLFEHEIIRSALCVLVNLVCPPPSYSNKTAVSSQGQQGISTQTASAVTAEGKDKNSERNSSNKLDVLDKNVDNAVDCGTSAPQTPTTSGLVGDRRISLGPGNAALATQLEQGYHQARESVRANNGIKILLLLLQPRAVTPPAAIDCVRALACRVLLGLARDDAIAHILTKLQVGTKLSELIRDVNSQTPGTELGRWQVELTKAAFELITIVTTSGRSSTLVASDAATPTLRRIERAAIAAATPISYDPRELLLLMHEHLVASGLDKTAATLLKEAQLTTLPSSAPKMQLPWPCGRTASGFLTEKSKATEVDSSSAKFNSAVSSCKKRSIIFSSSLSFTKSQTRSQANNLPSDSKALSSSRNPSNSEIIPESPSSSKTCNRDPDSQFKTPLALPMKRKFSESDGISISSSVKRFNTGERGIQSPILATPNASHKNILSPHVAGILTPGPASRCHHTRSSDSFDYIQSNACQVTPFPYRHPGDTHAGNTDGFTLDSIMINHLKNQHRQCSAPITTLPPLSLRQPHVCPEPSHSLDAPVNVATRVGRKELEGTYGGTYGSRRDCQFIYSRYRPWRTCRDDMGDLLTCITFLGGSSLFAVGTHNGELKTFDTISGNVIERSSHQQGNLTHLESYLHGEKQFLLSSTPHDVCLWDASSSLDLQHAFGGCKAARFSNSGSMFAALSSEPAKREILLYDIETRQQRQTFTELEPSVSTRSKVPGLCYVHFSPEDTMLLRNGFLWDIRTSNHITRFDELSDFGGGGFHPAGNEVIINSEVWDIRNYKLLRSVPSLKETIITFNPSGSVIYAILRRHLDDITSAMTNRRVKDPLFAAFRTVDAISYSEIATVLVDRCVLDLAVDPTDSLVGLVTMDDQEEMFSSARIYEVGRRRPMDDDSDPDDDADTEEEEEIDSEDDDEDAILGRGLMGMDGDSDEVDSSGDDESLSDIDEEDAADVEEFDILPADEEDDMDSQSDESLGSSDEDERFGFF